MQASCSSLAVALFLLAGCLSRLIPVVRWLGCGHAAVLHEDAYQALL